MRLGDPEAIIEGPDSRGEFTAWWRGMDQIRARGSSPEAAKAALFDALVEALRAGLTEEDRRRIREFRRLDYAERARRVAPMLELTWSRV